MALAETTALIPTTFCSVMKTINVSEIRAEVTKQIAEHISPFNKHMTQLGPGLVSLYNVSTGNAIGPFVDTAADMEVIIITRKCMEKPSI